MSAVVRGATIVAVAVSLMWGVALAWGALVAGARAEYALAAHEARAVAVAMAIDPTAPLTPRRRIIAEGPLSRVRVEMVRAFGPQAAAHVAEDRALVHASGLRRGVSVPVKDADQWDVIGAVVLEAEAWSGALPILLAATLGALLAAVLAASGVRRLGAHATLSVYAAMIAPVAVLSVATAVVVALVRSRLFAAGATLPPPTPLARFDVHALPIPDGQFVGFLLALVLFLTSVALFAAGWCASARRHAALRRETIAAWSFLAPSALHLLVFTAGPLAFTLFVSLHDWDLLRADKPFVGFGNYAALARDPLFWQALRNTALYSLYVPVSMALALGAALLLDQPLRGVRVLRAIVFLPTVVSYAAIAVVWQWIFNFDFGLLNYVLRSLHLTGVDWLGDPRTALVAVMIVSAWVQIGYQMVIYLAGLQGIPGHLHEAARLDGAGGWDRFRYITLPLLRPVTVYLFVTGIIWSFQVFTLVYVMTEGGPVHSTDVLVYQIYQHAWEFRRMGYASAMSWVLFAILLAFTMLQWRVVSRKESDVAA